MPDTGPSLTAFDYELPPERIAERPCEPRDAARMLVVELGADRISHRRVRDLPDYLRADDLLVLNRTRVMPARLVGRKDSGGAVELLLIHPDPTGPSEHWRGLIRGKVRVGSRLHFPSDAPEAITAEVVALHDDGERSVAFPPGTDVAALAERIGEIPLPPYIKRTAEASDRNDYQTVFGDRPGSVAAPTASLHFTTELLARIAELGVEQTLVNLAVGPGTFKPVQSDELDKHQMHAEFCECPPESVAAIEASRQRAGRVIGVGTTVVRTLESACRDGALQPFAGWTRLFCHPPYRMQVCDGLLTNFHLPRSTLLMLVACYTGVERLRQLYAEAIAGDYRFYSYGDCMLLLP